MKVVILAGGLGTRIGEETALKPKPMVEIGGRPILWHIMKIYSAHGLNDFIVCCGYKGQIIKEYFANYALHNSDVTFNMRTGEIQVHRNASEPWNVTLVDTGLDTLTGGRIKRVLPYVGGEPFCCTYGDGVGDVALDRLIDFHQAEGKLATLTAAKPPGRFGLMTLEGHRVASFFEKPEEPGWVNGGFFVLSPGVGEYIEGDKTMWEREPLERLARAGELNAFFHDGFWQPMDTLRDRNLLEELWRSRRAPWKIWEDG
ncbi:MAG: glucose-1-phosphate cytidylyltransferase [Armatimonadetes bacterium]|nr:glucose-1-phosphate cytidylyltransferase [Armatimonadota bacterium]